MARLGVVLGVKVVYREQHTVAEIVTGVVCDSCNAEGAPGEFHEIEVSKLDDRLGFVVCTDCLNGWVKTFKTPVSWSTLMEDPPRRVIHSETGEVMWHTAMGWLLGADEDAPEGSWWWGYFSLGAELLPGCGIYKHHKGRSYQVIDHAFTPSREPHVIYRALYGDSLVYARPARMWAEHVEREGYSGPRFVLIKEVEEPCQKS